MTTILLAEDDPISMKLMRDVLQASGYDTIEVTNGADAVSAARRVVPQMVVMDIDLPRLNGIEATGQLRLDATTRSIPVLAVSAHAMPEDEERVRAAGCDAYLRKPLRFSEFMATVRGLLDRSQ